MVTTRTRAKRSSLTLIHSIDSCEDIICSIHLAPCDPLVLGYIWVVMGRSPRQAFVYLDDEKDSLCVCRWTDRHTGDLPRPADTKPTVALGAAIRRQPLGIRVVSQRFMDILSWDAPLGWRKAYPKSWVGGPSKSWMKVVLRADGGFRDKG